jgi:hypothetical protein
LFCFLFFSNVVALSEQASNASVSLSVAKSDIDDVLSRGLSVSRMNESYFEALQIYDAQLNLEKLNRKTNYEIVLKYTSDIRIIKENELLAKDELDVFINEYASMNNSLDLSEMNELYNNILKSFSEERFEDTLKLIPEGYDSLTSIQSSQTALNVFYSATSSSIKNFFYNNWIKLVVIFSLIFLFWIFFHTPIRRWNVRRKINSLEVRKNTLKSLMKNLQKQYFESKKISEQEYVVKMKSFDDLLLDITRQILLLKEEIDKQEIKVVGKKVN